ncbi:transaldolase [Jaminaea rosea]|uniref:Transaldolase n=1 Tax=Jaminaea rosea TaxID=1569628 RepID=A0A316UW64_9BASI|nr:transaldolase [Jaminaea rosea]PWN29540.1 transaldolase [Jaminaea rosea]
MSTVLDSLKQYTTVVADSGAFEQLKQYKPQDATTNPSLILAAIKEPSYAKLVDVAVEYAKKQGGDKEQQVSVASDQLLVQFGKEILNIVPGRVSTEVDARLSFDSEATKAKARSIIAMYKEIGIEKERILIKIASTFQGIQAARDLEKEGIHCNLTLLFGFCQAVACAEAGVTLISPFVGRILDWFKQNKPDGNYDGANDPGVQSVQKIYNYYKQHGYKTIVMGASFRTTDEIKNLAGCDFLTISPGLLEKLQNEQGSLERKLTPESAKSADKMDKVSFVDDQAEFQWQLLQDQMAFDKLHQGIYKFAEDAETMKGLIAKKL